MVFHEMIVNVFAFWWAFFPAYEPLPYGSFPTPGEETVGLVRDESNNLWWANDMQIGRIVYYDDEIKVWQVALEWPQGVMAEGEPGPMALNENSLFVVVEEAATGFIRRYDILEDPDAVRRFSLTEVPPRIEIPPSARRRDPSITGLTHDGEHLWLVTDCGLCSVLVQFDPEDGRELYDFFPACAARGLGFQDPLPLARRKLWMVAYNPPPKRSLLSRRKITGNPAVVNTSREYFAFKNEENPAMGPPRDPTAMAVRGFDIWVVDRGDDSIRRYSAVDLTSAVGGGGDP